MAVDTKLNEMINSIGTRLRFIRIDDCELSVRALKALRAAGASTMHDAETLRAHGKLTRGTNKEVRELVERIGRLTSEEFNAWLAKRLGPLGFLVEDTPVSEEIDMLKWQLEQKETQYQRLVENNNALQADVSRLSKLLTERDEYAAKLRRRLTCVLDGMTVAQLKRLSISLQIDWDEVDDV